VIAYNKSKLKLGLPLKSTTNYKILSAGTEDHGQTTGMCWPSVKFMLNSI